MPLHTNRITKFSEFIGNETVIWELGKSLKRKKSKRPKTFLLTGPAGCGKTTIARIIKSELKCSDIDFIELNASDDRGIGTTRKLKELITYSPINGNCKIIFLDEAHMITKEAQESLLKMIEEPPEDVYFCIATTNPEKFTTTFKRRCFQYNLSLLTNDEMEDLLKITLKKEKIKKYPKKIKELIIDLADGSPGEALKLLDQVIEVTDPKEAEKILSSSGYSEKDVKDICSILLSNRKKEEKWKAMCIVLKSMKRDPESTRYGIINYLNAVFLNGKDVSHILDNFVDSFIYSGKAGLSLACYFSING